MQADWFDDLPGARSVGAGQFRWYGFAIYEARLWSKAQRPGLETPFALEVTFLRKVKRETLVEISRDEIRRLGGEDLPPERLARWTLELRRAFVDVNSNQRITGVFMPGRGCRFYVDGLLRHEVMDPVFARAFFSIWLDPRTRSPKLRRALLGL
ncbi:chalcone isomerase family protein [Pseudomonas alkylphenolica]|uniref:chalcone isomerase family protein n=1 Tax=Pseudomonas alkylphenolica TaxID=237609 RepID=UPI00315DDD4D